jgi:membrane protease YdiL (CAAX protease family)
MSAYDLAVWSLIGALFTQALAAGLAMEVYLRPDLPRATGRSWLAIAIASLLLALHHGYSFELAIRIGLYDMRQAVLAGLVGIFFALGVFGFRQQQA